MFLLKTKGTDKIADFLEIRDQNFALIQYIKLSNIDKKIPQILSSYHINTPSEEIIKKIKASAYGQIIKVE